MRLRNIFIKKILPVLMIAAISCMIVNKAVFIHSHVTTEGIVVTHSHPYDKSDNSPYKSHEHSKSEILFFQQLNVFFAIAFIAFFIFLLQSNSNFSVFIITHTDTIYYLTKKGRAPPVS